MPDLNSLPCFARIKPESVEAAIDNILQANREELQRLLTSVQEPTWENLLVPLEELDDRLHQTWSPVAHLNAVMNSDALRQVYNACLPKLSDYHTEFAQNEALYTAMKQLAEGPHYLNLDNAQQKIIQDHLRDFRLSGIGLDQDKKQRYKEISKELSQLTSQFSDNVLDATQAWTKAIEDINLLQGLPETALQLTRETAQAKNLSGYLLNLEFPCYHAVMTYADNRELRKEMYTAYVTRASDQGPYAGQWDNSAVIDKILARRYEEAKLVGFTSYAQYSLATKMAKDSQQVLSFLNDLAQRSLPKAKAEFAELKHFAHTQGVDTFEPWDISYYSEKLKLKHYALSDEELRPYLPLHKVLNGLFAIAQRLYAVQVQEVTDVDKWHPDVQFFNIFDANGQLRGQFYIDLYARANKRGGAWMDECKIKRRLADGSIQTPVAYLVCNFMPPVQDKPALLTHDEVTTLFHEFGHGLHHMLTKVQHADASGINGVPWDAVELPSQFMENWCWEAEALPLFSGHYESNAPLPDALLAKLLAAKNFQAAMQMLRQLEFSLFDFRLHLEYSAENPVTAQQILDQIRQELAVYKVPVFNRFQHSFSHIFAGGYAAGYYSYKWAEVLSADAFSKFEERGIFDSKTGEEFLTHILEVGGSREPMESFVAFRGREPSIDALLRHSGII